MKLYTEDAILFGSVDELQKGREQDQRLFRRTSSRRAGQIISDAGGQ